MNNNTMKDQALFLHQ